MFRYSKEAVAKGSSYASLVGRGVLCGCVLSWARRA